MGMWSAQRFAHGFSLISMLQYEMYENVTYLWKEKLGEGFGFFKRITCGITLYKNPHLQSFNLHLHPFLPLLHNNGVFSLIPFFFYTIFSTFVDLYYIKFSIKVEPFYFQSSLFLFIFKTLITIFQAFPFFFFGSMKLKIRVEDQMADLSLRNPFPLFIALTFFLLCLGFLGFRFSSFLLTSIALIMSMLYFSISKRNSLPIEKFVQEEQQNQVSSFVSDRKSSLPAGDFLSESECAGDNFTTTEESEVEWPFFDRFSAKNMDRSDDGSISDEESLIEIALPTGHYVSQKFDDVDGEEDEEDDMSFRYRKLSDFQKQKKNLVELWAEINDINEEENLIEIDISMGSIKYSRFEIEA